MIKRQKYKRMLNRFSVTITDVNGSRHFYLSQVIKRVIFGTLAFIALFVVGSTMYISYLSKEVSALDSKRKELAALNELIEQNMSLQAKLYAGFEEQLDAFEKQLGIHYAEDNNLTPKQKIANLSLTDNQQKEILAQIPNGLPVLNAHISDKYGWRDHPILKKQEFHAGLDFAATLDSPVYATANGVVEFSGFNNNGYGFMVRIAHNFGFKTVYAHLKNKVVVRQGEFVKKGDVIGYSGNTGLSTGPHLHYEVRFADNSLNPRYFVNLNRQTMNDFFKQDSLRRVSWDSLVKLIPTQANLKPQ